MVVEKTKHKIKCDASGCNKTADFTIVNRKFVFDGNVYLCKNCLAELYGEISKLITPKNVKPLFKGVKNEQKF